MRNVHSHTKGDHAELRVMAAIRQCGWNVLDPFGDNLPYDLVAEWDDNFVKIQVKASQFDGSSIVFRCYNSNTSRSGSNRTSYTSDDVDGVAVYSDETETCYWIPVDELNVSKMHLNVDGSGKRDATEYRLFDSEPFCL
jgi:hypothetical protein